MTTAIEMQTKVAKFETNMGRFDRIVNGTDTENVETDSGLVPSIANLQKQFVGWSPVLAGVPDGARRVFQVADWTGANPLSPKPPTGGYVGATGLVSSIALATNFRGEQGPAGSGGGGGSGGLTFTTVVTYGAVGDGVTDCTTAFQNANSDGLIVVPEGLFRINSAATFNAPMVFLVPHASQIRAGANYTVTLNGPVAADPYAHIFDTSESNSAVKGLFGFVPLSPCWFGAVSDGFVDGTGTNNLVPFRKCFLARTRVGAPADLIDIPGGRFFVEGSPAAAVPNPGYAPGNGQPENLIEAGILQVYQGTWIRGAGMGPTQIIIGNGSSGVVLAMGGKNTSGPPSGLTDILIGAELGGAANCSGPSIYANGATVQNVWGSGFSLGFLADSTDQTWNNLISEYAGFSNGHAAFRITRGGNTFTQLLAYLMSDGFVIDHQDTQLESIFSLCRAQNFNNATGRYGFVVAGTNTKAKFSDCYVDGDTVVTAYYGINCTELQFDNCTARLKNNATGVHMENVQRVTGSNMRVRNVGGTTPTSSRGFRNQNSNYFDFSNCHAEGFWRNYEADTTGVLTRFTNSTLINGVSRGALINQAAHSVFSDNFVAYNGTLGSSNDVGVEGFIRAAFQIHAYNNNVISNQNNAITDTAMRIEFVGTPVGFARARGNMFCYTPAGLTMVPTGGFPGDVGDNNYITA